MSRDQKLARAILLTAGPVVLFGPMLVQGKALYWGTPMLQFIPWRELALRSVSLGQLPLWNALLGMGAPLLANYQSALLYPPNLLLALTGPAWGQGLLVALHLIWAAWGMALLVRKLGLGVLPQVIAGLGFSLSGYMVARAGFLTINAAAAWLPWLILAAERLVEVAERGKPWSSMIPSTAILSLVLCLQWLAGHAQTAWYSLVILVFWVLWRAMEGRKDVSPTRAVVGLIAAGGFAFALAAIQLIPTLEYLANSQRSGAVGRELALTYSFWPWRLIGLVAPNLFGNPASGDYWGYGNFWEDAIYIGVLPVVMAVAGLIQHARKGSRHSGLVRLLAIAGGLSFLLALGMNTPIFPFLFDHVPTFDLFQAPTRWTLILVFCMSLLAAVGVEGWTRPTGRGLYWSRLGTVGAAVVMVASPLGLIVLNGVQVTFVRGLVWAGGLLCVTGILTLAHPIEKSSRWLWLAGCVVLLDLTLAGAGLNPSIDASVFKSQIPLSNGDNGNRSYMTAETEYKLKFGVAFPFSSFDSKLPIHSLLDLGIPDTLILQGRSSANNFDPILPERYAVLVGELDWLQANQQRTIMQLMGVSSFESLDGDGRLRQTAVENARRVRVVGSAQWVTSGPEALAHILDPSFNPDKAVVLEGGGSSQSADIVGNAEIMPSAGPNEVRIQVSTDSQAWVVLSDVWYPGWRAFVDDGRVEIYRADYLFRAVSVPKGEHTVRFEYSPFSFWSGLSLSAIAWLALAGLVWRQRRG
jgi:hypothetical protein